MLNINNKYISTWVLKSKFMPNQFLSFGGRNWWADDLSQVDVVYLDFQKAQKVPHQRQLLKLKAHGTGNYVIWIEK